MNCLASSHSHFTPAVWIAIGLLALAAPGVAGCARNNQKDSAEEGAPRLRHSTLAPETDSSNSAPERLGDIASMEEGLAGHAAGPDEKDAVNSDRLSGVQTTGDAAAADLLVSPDPLSKGEYDRVLSALRGKVVLVDCWGTWCIPCRGLLPHTAQLSRRHARDGLSVITLAFDEPESIVEVNAVLKEVGISGSHFIVQGGAGEEAFAAFEISGGTLPHYKIYDRDGRLRTSLSPQDAPVTTDAVDRAVAEALAQKMNP